MTSPDETTHQTSRERLSALTAALLRIGASLDLDTVLEEVADGRASRGCRNGTRP